MYIEDFELNNLQDLICHKNPTKTKLLFCYVWSVTQLSMFNLSKASLIADLSF